MGDSAGQANAGQASAGQANVSRWFYEGSKTHTSFLLTALRARERLQRYPKDYLLLVTNEPALQASKQRSTPLSTQIHIAKNT